MSALSELRIRTMANVLSAVDTGAKPWDILQELGQIGNDARPIVIQGGLSSDAYLYDPFKRMLQARGFKDVTTTGLDLHGFASFQRDAKSLARMVQAASERSKAAGGDGLVTVIAHSKGGLTARWYLQKLGGVEHVDQLLTLGTPHNGLAPNNGMVPYGTRLGALSGLVPIDAVKQLSFSSRDVRWLNRDLAGFMERARQLRPDFRIVSLAGDMGLPVVNGTDGLVSNAGSRLDESIPGLHNLVFKGHGAHHGAIIGQWGMFEPTLRSATLLSAGRPLEEAAVGAALLAPA